jgi:translocation and assembly module TamB
MAEPTPPTRAAATQPVSARPVATGLSLLWPAVWVAALLLAVAAAAGLAGRWLLTTDPGAQWLLQRLPGVQVQGWQGSVLGGTWQAERLRVQWGTAAEWVQVDGLNAAGVQWTWRPQPTAWAGLQVQRLQARLVTVHTGPRGKRPLPVPASLALPLLVQVAKAEVATLQVDDLPALQQLQAQDLLLDTQPGSQHKLAQAQAQWVGLQLQGSASIGTTAPLPVVLQLDAKPLQVVGSTAANTPWAAVARVQGDLARLQLQGNLRGVPGPPASGKPATPVNQPVD